MILLTIKMPMAVHRGTLKVFEIAMRNKSRQMDNLVNVKVANV